MTSNRQLQEQQGSGSRVNVTSTVAARTIHSPRPPRTSSLAFPFCSGPLPLALPLGSRLCLLGSYLCLLDTHEPNVLNLDAQAVEWWPALILGQSVPAHVSPRLTPGCPPAVPSTAALRTYSCLWLIPRGYPSDCASSLENRRACPTVSGTCLRVSGSTTVPGNRCLAAPHGLGHLRD